jgi:hypothetical protein
MSTNAELILDIRARINEVEAKLAQIESKARITGQRAGNELGNALKGAVSSILATISFRGVINSITNWVTASNELKAANIALNSVISTQNAEADRNNALLQSANLSLEEKGRLLGYTEDQMYRTVTVTKGYNSEVNRLQASIRRSTEAFEAENRIRQKNLDQMERSLQTLRKENEAKLKAAKQALGYDEAAKKKEELDLQIDTLELARAQAVVNNQSTAQIDQQIKTLRQLRDVEDKKLDIIEKQTRSIKQQGREAEAQLQTKIAELREEMAAARNRFDIDIEPAKTKLAELQAAMGGGGTQKVKVFDEGVRKQIEKATTTGLAKIDNEKVEESVNTLFVKYEKVVSKSTLSNAFKNVFLRGVTDVDLATKLVDRFVNSAAIAKSTNIDLSTAVVNLSEAFRTGNSVLGNASGISENFSMIQRRAIQIYNQMNQASVKRFDELTKEQQANALAAATLEITTDRAEGFTNAQKNGLIEQEKMRAEMLSLSQTLGQMVMPEFVSVVKQLADFLAWMVEFTRQNPIVVKGLLGLALAFSALAVFASTMFSVMNFLGFLSGILGPIWASVGGLNGVLTVLVNILVFMLSPLGMAISALVVFGLVLVGAYQRVGWFRDMVNSAFEQIKGWLVGFRDDWQNKIGEIVGFFVSLPVRLVFWVGQAIGQMWNLIRNQDWNMMGNMFREGFLNGIAGVESWFKNGGLNSLLKSVKEGVKNFFKGMIKGIFAGIPGGEGFANTFVANIDKLASGGMVEGQNTLAILNDGRGVMKGPEYVVNAPATRLFGPLLEAMNNLGRSGVVNNNTTNYIQNNYGSGAGTGFLPSVLAFN